jgi:hypothetical protein
MANQPINLFGGFYRDPNLPWSSQDCLNFLVVPTESAGTRTQSQLREFGRRPFVQIIKRVGEDVVDAGPIRGQRNVEGKLFVVAGTTLFQISNTGVAIPYGTVPGVGRVSMTHNQRGNGNELKIVNGSAGYVFNTSTLLFQKITDEGYPGEVVTDFIDGYVAGVETQGRFWEHSELADALNYNTLDRYEAEGFPDRIVTLIVSHREVLVFGNDSIEPYVNTGGTTGTFERAANTVIEGGCTARFSPKKLDNSVFYLDDKRIVRRLEAYNPVRVSTGPIDAALWECAPNEIAAAYGMTLEWNSHKVYILTVPGRFSFAYDVWSKEWTRLSTNGQPHFAVTDLTLWNGLWVAGDSRSGRLYVLDWDYILDGHEELERELVSPCLADNQNPVTVNEIEFLFGPGGPVTVPVNFPDQPIGPGINGAAPDATAGMAYTYAYTLTEGDAPIAGCDLFNSNLPSGWSVSTTGVLTGTAPLELATYTFSIRVRDTNGLFAVVTDTIAVTTAAAIAIPTLQTQLFGINGGGAFNIAEQITQNNFSFITDATEPWARIFCWSYTANTGEAPPESRAIIYDAINQGGDAVYDSAWRGNPANQTAMIAALGVAGLGAYNGTIQDTPISEYRTYDSYLYASEPFVLPTDFGTYSGRSVAYRSQSRLDRSIHLEYPDPTEIPVGATKVDELPGCYMAAGQLYRCDWVEITE